MITETFDPTSEEILKVWKNEQARKVDACIVTFSHEILKYVLERYECDLIGNLYSSNGANPVYGFTYEGKEFAVYMSYVGAPACVADMEDTMSVIKTDKYIVFGGSGCLNKEIARGRVMVPTQAYRDEGTSYHYAPASDYITIKNSAVVEEFMVKAGLPYICGKTWTTDAPHRETRNNFEKRKKDGCISVEMECAAVEAMCTLRELDAYFFFTCGDLLDAPKWDARLKKNQKKDTQHDPGHFDIALELARYVTDGE
jgi:uridine phosphorylase